MKKIYKYEISVQEKFELTFPVGAEIIRCEDVDGKFYMWAIVTVGDDWVTHEKRFFECYKTGQPIETPTENLRYIGACKLFIMQELCLYVFEKINHE